ncbi:unnamed protein product [Auanema sp. JU1783]|nr:unnamed protein product [Auanema sp. JU1783]
MAAYMYEVVFPMVLTVTSWILLLLNILCFWCLIRGKLITTKENSIYIIIGYNVLSDTAATFVHALFVEPSIYFGEWLVSEATASFFGMLLWYTGLSAQILLALHRLFAVVFPHIFTFTHRFICFGLMFLTIKSFVATLLMQSIISCCRVKYYPAMFSYSFEQKNLTNYSRLYVYNYMNGSFTTVCVIAYTILLCHVFKVRSSTRSSNMKKEIRLGLQCALMFFVSTMTWIWFSLLSELNNTTQAVVSFLGLVHFCTNTMVYLFFNRDVKDQLNGMRNSLLDFFSTTSQK